MLTPKLWHLVIIILALLSFTIGAYFFFPQRFSFADTAWTLTSITADGDIPSDIEMANGTDGYLRVVYWDDNLDNLVFVQCTNADCSTNVHTIVDSTGSVGLYPTIAIAADGFARLSYYDLTNSSLKFAQCTNADCSISNVTTIDSTGDVGWYASLVMGGDGFGRISYYDLTNGTLKFAQCTSADCTSSTLTVVDSTSDVGQSSSVKIAEDGFARISYYDGENADLKFAQCTNDDCTSNNISTIDSTGSVGQTTTLAIAPDGFGRITYFDYSNTHLKYAQCTNDDCSTSNVTTIDSGGITGIFSSLTIASDGFARIAYYDSSQSQLRYAQCTDSQCSSKNTFNIDSDGIVGLYSFILFNSEGLGRIGYYDLSNQKLKLAFEEFVANTSSSEDGTSATSESYCTDETPVGVPNLFRVDTAGTYVNLYFTKAEQHASGYTVNYGFTPEANQFSDSFDFAGPQWVIGRTIASLSPKTTYYFRVQSRNGCNASEWSNSMKAKTKNRVANISTWFSNLVDSVKPTIETASTESSASGSPLNPTNCSYKVKTGDSYWKIATTELGSGTYSEKLKSLNPGVTILTTGLTIKLCN